MNMIPHEIHITVSQVDSLTHFVDCCRLLGVKPIILDLHTANNAIIKDMMTSSVIKSNTLGAHSYMNDLIVNLKYKGYAPIRGKIEVPPFHPDVPSIQNNLPHESGRYFESHIEVVLQNLEDLSRLKDFAGTRDIHVSANFFKSYENTKTIMLTRRCYSGTVEAFKNTVSEIRQQLSKNFMLTEKEIIEYCVYDSATSHDDKWIKS